MICQSAFPSRNARTPSSGGHSFLADSLEEAGKSFAFTRLPPRQSESTRTAKGSSAETEAFERRRSCSPATSRRDLVGLFRS